MAFFRTQAESGMKVEIAGTKVPVPENYFKKYI